jgi:copper chaperone CopZ
MNMTCKHCEKNVEALLKKIPNVTTAKANHTTKVVNLKSKEAIALETIKEALEAGGYQASFGDTI